MSEGNYASGEDYVVEFLGYRFGFTTLDFEERIVGAAVRLGLIEANGSKENNIVVTGVYDNFTPFRDDNPQCAPEAKFKALGQAKEGLIAWQSPDGIHWQRLGVVSQLKRQWVPARWPSLRGAPAEGRNLGAAG